MSTANDTNILAELIDGHDEDGQPTTIEITIIPNPIDGGYDIVATEDGDWIDGEHADDDESPREIAAVMASRIRKEDRARERNRLRDARKYAQECVLGAAEEMTGCDRDAVKLLARLIGQGKGEAALAYLKDVK